MPFIVRQAVSHHRAVVDQDIINVVFDAIPLPREYNVMPDTDVALPDKKPKLVHYAGVSKYHEKEYPPLNVRQLIKSLL